jgi:hypothetical protein
VKTVLVSVATEYAPCGRVLSDRAVARVALRDGETLSESLEAYLAGSLDPPFAVSERRAGTGYAEARVRYGGTDGDTPEDWFRAVVEADPSPAEV